MKKGSLQFWQQPNRLWIWTQHSFLIDRRSIRKLYWRWSTPKDPNNQWRAQDTNNLIIEERKNSVFLPLWLVTRCIESERIQSDLYIRSKRTDHTITMTVQKLGNRWQRERGLRSNESDSNGIWGISPNCKFAHYHLYEFVLQFKNFLKHY